MDVIRLRGVQARGFHGVLPAEQELGQNFVVDVDVYCDLSVAAYSDDVADTLDYSDLARSVVAAIEGPPFKLIEALGHHIVEQILEDPRAHEVVAVVHKPQAPMPPHYGQASIEIRRGRR